MPRISPGLQRERDVRERVRRPAGRGPRAPTAPSAASSIRSRGAVASALPAACATSAPSMNSTIFSSPPSCGTSVPTSLPSRRTVARSQWAITSRRRCVMKSAERPRSFCGLHDGEDALGEIGRKRGGDLVEDQQLRVARERARQIEHPQERQRHVERLLPEVDLEVELAQVPAHRVDRRAGQAEVLLDRQIGDECRILEDRREPDPRRLRRRRDARVARRSPRSCRCPAGSRRSAPSRACSCRRRSRRGARAPHPARRRASPTSARPPGRSASRPRVR